MNRCYINYGCISHPFNESSSSLIFVNDFCNLISIANVLFMFLISLYSNCLTSSLIQFSGNFQNVILLS